MIGNDNATSAWTCGTCPERSEECYLHNFLEEMPDFNLKDEGVVNEQKVVITYFHYLYYSLQCKVSLLRSVNDNFRLFYV